MYKNQIITKRRGTEYSTVQLPCGAIETCRFADDGTSEVIGRTSISLAAVAHNHIMDFEIKNNGVAK